MLNVSKRADASKIKELELEVRKLKANELKMGKYKSENPNNRRAQISDDSDKEEDEPSSPQITR
jgi:hypothetical protein